jgi:hypothetical protein
MATTKYKARVRRGGNLAPHELQWLQQAPNVGAARRGVNPFSLLLLKYPHGPENCDAADALLDRAHGVVSERRLRELRRYVQQFRDEHRKCYPRHPAYMGHE